jgi:hypothetical protein
MRRIPTDRVRVAGFFRLPSLDWAKTPLSLAPVLAGARSKTLLAEPVAIRDAEWWK